MRTPGEKMQSEVLALLEKREGPQSAYDILDGLREDRPKLAATTIYRALTALTKRGIVHRLESRNAYVVCQCAQHQQTTILSICDGCGMVEETEAPDVLRDLSKVAEKTGFVPERHVVEILGRCGDCAAPEARA